jgi:hypothetical protein
MLLRISTIILILGFTSALLPACGKVTQDDVQSELSAAPAFPGRDKFGPGKSNRYILMLGEQLVRKGYGRHYRVGPSADWGEADRKNVQDFQ